MNEIDEVNNYKRKYQKIHEKEKKFEIRKNISVFSVICFTLFPNFLVENNDYFLFLSK